MSYHVFFSFSVGLSAPLQIPKGEKQKYIAHVEEVEKVLGLTRTQYKDNPVHWDHWKRDFSGIEDKVLCETVENHNAWCRECYEKFGHWAEHPFVKGEGHQAKHAIDRAFPIGWEAETLTPEDAQLFWHGFAMLVVPVEKWTEDYYRRRMEVLYEVMRGRSTEGIEFDVRALTPRQGAAVIKLFSEFLDSHDLRLDVPNGHDYLASSCDGGYDWCEKCGAVTTEDADACAKRKCPIRAERGE